MSDRTAGQSEGEHRLSTCYAGYGEWWARCECDRWSVVLVNGVMDAEACWREHLDEAAAVSPVSVEGDLRASLRGGLKRPCDAMPGEGERYEALRRDALNVIVRLRGPLFRVGGDDEKMRARDESDVVLVRYGWMDVSQARDPDAVRAALAASPSSPTGEKP